MKLSKEVRIGIVVTIAIVLFIYGYNFLKGKNLFSKEKKYYAVYYHVDGLVEANAVQINGFKIGRVSNVGLYPKDPGKVIVTFSLNNDDIQIPKNSIAKIVSSDLMGTRAVQLLLGNSKEYVQPGDTLLSDIQATLSEEVNAQVTPLKEKAENLILSIDSVMSVVQIVLNKDARENLSKSFESIKIAIETFQKTSMRFDTLIVTEKSKISNIFSKIEIISTGIANNNDKLSNIINNFSNISDSLAKANVKETLEKTSAALNQASMIMDKINKGEGSMGMLINNKDLYQHLDSAATNVNKLVNDLNTHPKKYVHFSIFGKKDK